MRGTTRGRARRAAVLIGVGMGGFVDGIALHQIAQWHNMLSARVPPHGMDAMRTNMTADGWFHAGVWFITLAGVLALWSAGRSGEPLPPLRTGLGWMLAGWGAFNLVEGIIDHHLLKLHHVRDVPVHVPALDWLFLLIGGVGFLLAGWALARSDSGRG
ncbi:MAG TPA: DUF2243 domain-containing protein [Longimicrobium sp.]|jgi:uncharacterized membrane protein|uniref:DUF2243 domain-containing protein n=1 Tax=Longimicrobium sp. TaxID=2029185 RepID=UPI002EDB4F88